MNNEQFTKMALSFLGTISQPHFNRTTFKITGKKIFATLDEAKLSANIILTPDEQKVFCAMKELIYPVAHKWGLKGWTTFEIKNLESGIILDGLRSAYDEVISGQ